MALSGAIIASDLTIGFLEPGSVTNYFDLSTYVNEDAQSVSVGEIDVTAHGTVWRQFRPGLKEGDYSFTVIFNTTPAAAQHPQHRLRQLLDNNTETTWRVRYLGAGTGLPEETWSGFLTAYEPDFANDDQAVTASITVKVNGAITSGFQS